MSRQTLTRQEYFRFYLSLWFCLPSALDDSLVVLLADEAAHVAFIEDIVDSSIFLGVDLDFMTMLYVLTILDLVHCILDLVLRFDANEVDG